MYTLLDKLWISHFYTGNAQCKLSICVLCSTCVCCTFRCTSRYKKFMSNLCSFKEYKVVFSLYVLLLNS